MGLAHAVLLTLVVAIGTVCLCYMYALGQGTSVGGHVKRAVDQSPYHPTVFQIYDRSTEQKCNRLIVVEPFGWHIWAANDELYILNPERAIQCGPANTPAVQVFPDRFVETCLSVSLESIVRVYVGHLVPVEVPYTIDEPTFTVLSALNILLQQWIPLAKEQPPADTVRMATSHQLVPTEQSSPRSEHQQQQPQPQPRPSRPERVLTGAQVNQVASAVSANTSHLMDQFRVHLGDVPNRVPTGVDTNKYGTYDPDRGWSKYKRTRARRNTNTTPATLTEVGAS